LALPTADADHPWPYVVGVFRVSHLPHAQPIGEVAVRPMGWRPAWTWAGAVCL